MSCPRKRASINNPRLDSRWSLPPRSLSPRKRGAGAGMTDRLIWTAVILNKKPILSTEWVRTKNLKTSGFFLRQLAAMPDSCRRGLGPLALCPILSDSLPCPAPEKRSDERYRVLSRKPLLKSRSYFQPI